MLPYLTSHYHNTRHALCNAVLTWAKEALISYHGNQEATHSDKADATV